MGKLIDNRYRIIERIGRGGMGSVYLAEDTRLDRQVAVKRLSLIGHAEDIHVFRDRFEREAKVMARFHHPNIVSVHDYGQDDEGVYLVLEYMPGGSLAQQMRERRYSVEEAIQVLLPLADALQAIHQRNRVHRDVKPSNILFDEYGNPKLADFGVVKLLEGEEGHTLTATGAAVGTPAYMAPELIGGEASPATDQYALGVVLYELVTGKKPFMGRTPMETLTMQKYEPLPDPRSINPELPDWMCEVIQTALAKQPEDRYVDIQTFANVLRAGEPAVEEKAAIVVEEEATMVPQAPIPAEFTDEIDVMDEEETLGALAVQQIEYSPSTPIENKPLQKKKFPVWMMALIAVVLVSAAIGIGSRLINQDTEGSAQLALLTAETLILPPTVTVTVTQTATITKTSAPTKTHTPTVSPTPTLGIGSIMLREKDGMEMLFVPAGTFTMGSNDGDTDEQPVHEVYVDGYWIDKYEVTNAQYAMCVMAGVCSEPYSMRSNIRDSYYDNNEFTNYPMINVDWYQAQAYCEWTGGSLPTEAQWEKAARGTDGRTYPWGETPPTCDLASYSYCEIDTNAVGSCPDGASPYGALDMAGNVWEWVADWYKNDYYAESPAENPTGPTSGSFRGLRGGAFLYSEDTIITFTRGISTPGVNGNYYFGFRCAFPAPD